MSKRLTAAVLYISCTLLAGCSLNNIPFLYHVDVQQGNVLKAEAIAKLQQGMTKSQVEFLMGTPSITDPFHPNRWDYVYTNQPGGERMTTKRLTLFFQGDKLQSASGGALPADSPLRTGTAKS